MNALDAVRLLESRLIDLLPAEAAERLGWTLLHSLWQLALVALPLLLLRPLWSRSSQAAHGVCCAALALMAAAPIATFCWLSAAAAPAEMAALPSLNELSVDEPAEPVPADSRPPTAAPAATVRGVGNTPVTLPEAGRAGWPSRVAHLWLAGVLLAAARPLLGWAQVRRLRRVGLSPAPRHVRQALSRLASALRLRRVAQVAQSALVDVPCVVGWLRPLVLLPASALTGLSARELESVLAHELAHVRRGDWLVNLLQTAAETLLFYHPAVWWVSRQIRCQRELCCDDLALSVVKDRAQYARALTALDQLRLPSASPALAADGGSLVQRIRRLAAPRQPAGPSSWAGAALLTAGLAAVLLVACCWPEPGAAGAQETPPAEPPAQVKPQAPQQETPAENKGAAGTETLPEESERRVVDDRLHPGNSWLRQPPFGELGIPQYDEIDRYHVRLAAHAPVLREIDAEPPQSEVLRVHYEVLQARSKEIGNRDREALQALWKEIRETSEAVLTDAQRSRVRQILFQQLGYRVFLAEQFREDLGLSSDQRERIRAEITAHGRRVRANGRRHADRAKQLADEVPAAELPVRLRQLNRQRVAQGIESHRRVWRAAYDILTPAQRKVFEKLRGPAVRGSQADSAPRAVSGDPDPRPADADAQLASQIAEAIDALQEAEQIGQAAIEAQVTEGVVRLEGTVGSLEDMQRVTAKVATFAGVRRVVSELRVAGPKRGTLRGRVLYDGRPPEQRRIEIGDTGTLDGRSFPRSEYRDLKIYDESLKVGPSGGLANVFVYLRSNHVPPLHPNALHADPATLTVRRGKFTPRALPAWTRRPLRLVNDEEVATNVHGPGFNVLVPAGKKQHVELRPHKLPAKMTSDIYPWMISYVLPLRHPYAAVTAEDGTFEIGNMPLGTWEIVFWHEKSGYLETDRFPSGRLELKIESGKNDLGTLHVDPENMQLGE